jgi:hypothetical protein
LGLNRPFIEVAHFENTMGIDLEILKKDKKMLKFVKNPIFEATNITK